MLMKKRVATTKVRPFIFACLTALVAFPEVSIATVGTGPAINLFTPMSIESLSATSKSAKALESSLETLIEKLETQSSLYEAANCSVSIPERMAKASFGPTPLTLIRSRNRRRSISLTNPYSC